MAKPEILNVAVNPEVSEQMLTELTPTFERLYDEHVAITGEGQKGEWFPHKCVPYDVGRTYESGYVWKDTDLPLPAAVRSALIVGLLTEDNLPHYTTEIAIAFKNNEALRHWNNRWTAEEDRHSTVLREFLHVSRLVDPVQLERDKMAQIEGAKVPRPPTALDGLVYVTFQELATRLAHVNSGKATKQHVEASITDGLDPSEIEHRRIIAAAAGQIMTRVSKDENLHYAFYRGTVEKAMELDPSATLVAIYNQVTGFEMPGTGIRDIVNHSALIARAGIYNPRNHFKDILEPLVVKRWKIEELTGLTEEGKLVQEGLVKYLAYEKRRGEVFAKRFDAPDFGPMPGE